jgi:signal transduction histidine kinase
LAKRLLKVLEDWDIGLKVKSLKLRILIWFGGILSTILTLFSFSFYYFLEENINLTIQTNLYHKAIYIQESILLGLTKNRLIKGNNLIGLEIAIIKSGKIIAQTESFTLKNFKKYIENENSFFVSEIEEENVEAIYRLNFKKPFKGVILIYQKGINNKAEDVEDTMLILVPLLLLLLLFAGSKLIDKILIPIKNITKTTKEITVNNFSNTIPKPKYNDEIRELVDSFNDMIERLKEGVERIDRFNSDVSHELKTPLTVIKGEIEITLKKSRDSKYYQQSLKTILFETDQIQTIVQNLLLLTKYTKENIKNSFEICYIDELLLNSINQYP